MIQHFHDNNVSFLCCQPEDIKERLTKLTDESITDIKNIPSIAKYLKESGKSIKGNDKLDNEKFKVHTIYNFHSCHV